jgi:hypothetical protein
VVVVLAEEAFQMSVYGWSEWTPPRSQASGRSRRRTGCGAAFERVDREEVEVEAARRVLDVRPSRRVPPKACWRSRTSRAYRSETPSVLRASTAWPGPGRTTVTSWPTRLLELFGEGAGVDLGGMGGVALEVVDGVDVVVEDGGVVKLLEGVADLVRERVGGERFDVVRDGAARATGGLLADLRRGRRRRP